MAHVRRPRDVTVLGTLWEPQGPGEWVGSHPHVTHAATCAESEPLGSRSRERAIDWEYRNCWRDLVQMKDRAVPRDARVETLRYFSDSFVTPLRGDKEIVSELADGSQNCKWTTGTPAPTSRDARPDFRPSFVVAACALHPMSAEIPRPYARFPATAPPNRHRRRLAADSWRPIGAGATDAGWLARGSAGRSPHRAH